MFQYTKKMSRTDAMMPTKGRIKKFLVLTGHGNKDNSDKFYKTLFQSDRWYEGLYAKNIVQKLDVKFHYYYNGIVICREKTLITHSQERAGVKNTPITWLHWPDEIRNFFKDHDLTDAKLKIYRRDKFNFIMSFRTIIAPTKTTIVNVKSSPCEVYIGRGSTWGNPYIIGKDGTRNEVIKKFNIYALKKVRKGEWNRTNLSVLKDKKLGCYCHPKKCHGETLVKIVEKLCG